MCIGVENGRRISYSWASDRTSDFLFQLVKRVIKVAKERGKYLTELRRSNAAGLHNQRPTRSAYKQAAIEEDFDPIGDVDFHPGEPHSQNVCTFGCWLNQNPEEKKAFFEDIIGGNDECLFGY